MAPLQVCYFYNEARKIEAVPFVSLASLSSDDNNNTLLSGKIPDMDKLCFIWKNILIAVTFI